MRAGEFDRLVTIQQQQVARAASGAEVKTWIGFADVWAKRVDEGGKEFFDGDRPLSEERARFRIYYLAGVTAKMRVLDEDGRVWDIQSKSEIGRREGLFLNCTAQEEAS